MSLPVDDLSRSLSRIASPTPSNVRPARLGARHQAAADNELATAIAAETPLVVLGQGDYVRVDLPRVRTQGWPAFFEAARKAIGGGK